MGHVMARGEPREVAISMVKEAHKPTWTSGDTETLERALIHWEKPKIDEIGGCVYHEATSSPKQRIVDVICSPSRLLMWKSLFPSFLAGLVLGP